MAQYEDDGTWVWVSLASKSRLVISHAIGERKQYMANRIINETANRLATMPLFVTDGLRFYTKALLNRFGKLIEFLRTGKRGRPRIPKIVPTPGLKYAQVIKHRKDGHLCKVEHRIIFGEDIDPGEISTSLIERQNLTFRQDNNRISRKTIGFSKIQEGLEAQLMLYFTNFNFCRGHWSLKHRNNNGCWEKYTPAREQGLTDHNWTLRELLTFPYHQYIN